MNQVVSQIENSVDLLSKAIRNEFALGELYNSLADRHIPLRQATPGLEQVLFQIGPFFNELTEIAWLQFIL